MLPVNKSTELRWASAAGKGTQVDPIWNQFNVVSVAMWDEQAVVSGMMVGIEIIEHPGFVTRKPCAFRTEQPTQRAQPPI